MRKRYVCRPSALNSSLSACEIKVSFLISIREKTHIMSTGGVLQYFKINTYICSTKLYLALKYSKTNIENILCQSVKSSRINEGLIRIVLTYRETFYIKYRKLKFFVLDCAYTLRKVKFDQTLWKWLLLKSMYVSTSA